MKITIESTTKIVELINGNVYGSDSGTRARIWQGLTEYGIPVHCYVTRIALAKENPTPEEAAQFEKDLQEQRPPTAAVEAISLRLIL